MVEGASGFGTPAALGAPMLVSLGHPPCESVVVLLLFNTFATVWGAVGTPIWFGFGGDLGLSEDEFLEVSQKAGVALAFGAFLLMPLVLRILVPILVIKANIRFVIFSLITVIGPSLGISFVTYEFPALIGGVIGCAGTAVLISNRVGLHDFSTSEDAGSTTSSHSNDGGETKPKRDVSFASVDEDDVVAPPDNDNEDEGVLDKDPAVAAADETGSAILNNNNNHNIPAAAITTLPGHEDSAHSVQVPIIRDTADEHFGPRKRTLAEGYYQELVARTFPIWAVVLILILTRVENIGIKKHLIKQEPSFSIHFGSYGTFKLSASLVFSLQNILTYPNLNWKYELLYVPFLIPFVLVSVAAMIVYRKDMKCGPYDIAKTVGCRLKNPAIALMGALVLVQLLIRSDAAAPAYILGTILSDWFQQAFVIICPLLGCLGSFFSGSTTVSNLTIGEVQRIAAESIGVSTTTMLALQAVGASAGNGVCLNNVIAACAVVGLNTGEGKIIVQTYKFVFANMAIATIVMLAFYFRF
jgi:L-lactate permease